MRKQFLSTYFLFVAAIIGFAALCQNVSYAQDEAALNIQSLETDINIEEQNSEVNQQAVSQNRPDVNAVNPQSVTRTTPLNNVPNELDLPSLLFSLEERRLIKDAQNAIGQVRAPTDDDKKKDQDKIQEVEKVKPPLEKRNIRLSGIVFNSPQDYVVWLNGKRIASTEQWPVEVINFQVFEDYIEIRWFDDFTNQIYPIRLRPNQYFNIDTRVFLPG